MAKKLEENEVLPGVRSDIKLYVDSHADDGSPTYTVHDPIKGGYWKISWQESLVLQYCIPGMTVEALDDKINSRTICKVTQEKIVSFFKQAKLHNLLKEEKTGEQLYGEWEATVYSYGFYFIYTHVAKVLAVLISLIVIGNYLVYPLLLEYKHFKIQNLHLAHPIQYRLVNVLIIVILLGIVLLLPNTIAFEAITAPVNSQNVYASTSLVVKFQIGNAGCKMDSQ